MLCRSFGFGGDRKASVEGLYGVLRALKRGEWPQPLPDRVNPIRRKLRAHVESTWKFSAYRMECPAKTSPQACMLCSDGQVLACYLFGNNKTILDRIVLEEENGKGRT